MKLSDLVPLMEGVFQLEEGHGEWNADQCEAVVIAFAGSEAKLDLNKFEKDQEVLCVVSPPAAGKSLTAIEVFHRHSRMAVSNNWKSTPRAGMWNQHLKGLKSWHRSYTNFSLRCLWDRK